MKKLLLMIPVIALMTSSCRKTPETTAVKPQAAVSENAALINDVTTKSDAFVKAYNKTPHTLSFLHDLFCVVFADVAGALGGLEAGAAASGGNAGVAVGAAVVGGVIASVEEAGGLKVGPGNGGVFGGGSGAANSANPYDNVGFWHYKLVNNCLLTPGLVSYAPYTHVDVPLYYSYATSQLINNGVVSSTDMGYYTQPACAANFSNVMNTMALGQTFSQYSQAMVNNGQMTNDEKLILDPYMMAVEHATDLNSFISYSVSVEASVNNSTTLSAKSKQVVLAFMSTARWGVAYYW